MRGVIPSARDSYGKVTVARRENKQQNYAWVIPSARDSYGKVTVVQEGEQAAELCVGHSFC